MASDEELEAPVVSLAERLHRLTQRRRAAAAAHEAASDEEAQAPSMSSAMQALRDLIEQRDVDLVPASSDEVGHPIAVGACRYLPNSPPLWQASTAVPGAGASPTACGSPKQSRIEDSEACSEGSTAVSACSSTSAACAINSSEGGPLEREMQGAVGLQSVLEPAAAAVAHSPTEAPQLHLNALLAHQAAAAERRERQRLERQAQLQRAQLAFAEQHMAVWRICRAWHRHLGSPARLRRVAAATAVQAAWRGCVSRRMSAALLLLARQRRALLAELHTAVATKQQQRVRGIAERLTALGGGLDAQELVTCLEQQASAAALALQIAASQGTAADFQAAAEEAGQYSDLAEPLHQAGNVFQARVAAAALEVEKTLQEATLADFQATAAVAAALGVGTSLLQSAEQRMTQRDLQASTSLRAAVNATPFDKAIFSSCLQLAQRFGLHRDSQRAQRALQLRRQRAASRLLEAAGVADAAAVEANCLSAEQLGLAAEAEVARLGLAQRQADSLHELLQASLHGCLEQFTAAVAASERLGVSAARRQVCSQHFLQRQQQAEQLLRESACHDNLVQVRKRCREALSLGLYDAVAAAQQHLDARRQDAAVQLASSTRAACDSARQQAELAKCAGLSKRDGTQQPASLRSWCEQLAAAAEQVGVEEALSHPPVVCASWPEQVTCWLKDALSAAGLELAVAATQAVHTFRDHLRALEAAACCSAVCLLPAMAGRGSDTPDDLPTASYALACYRAWQAMQRPLLPRMAAAAQQAAAAQRAADTGDTSGDEDGQVSTAQLAGCGIVSLDLAAWSSTMPASAGLARLRLLDLSENRLTSAALAAASLSVAAPRLTELKLSGNQLTDLAWMGLLPNLLRLDASHNSLSSLAGLAEAAPLLQDLEASHNALTSLPSTLHLMFLRDLRLEGNRLAEAALAWPWLPSLQRLHLGNCCLSTPPNLQGCPSLRTLDLSSNQLASLPNLLTALSSLRGCLRQLNVGGNPLPQQQGSCNLVHANAGGQHQHWQQISCRASILSVVPLLRQLDGQPVMILEQQQRRMAAAARWRPSSALADSSYTAKLSSMDWDVHTLLWLLHQPATAAMAEQSGRQNDALDAAAAHQQQHVAAQCSLSLPAVLAAVQQAASLGTYGVHCSQHLRHTDPSCTNPSRGGSRLHHLHLLHKQYQLLAAAGPAAAQDMLVINAAHYQCLHSRLHAAATAIQAAWRRYAACASARGLEEHQRASREGDAAAAIQAAWRGWACRTRQGAWIQDRLASWRHQWRQAQQLALSRQQHFAAARMQAAWRGWRVRKLVLQARAALLLQKGLGNASVDDSLDLELPDSPLSLSSFMEAGSTVLNRPEALCPELASDARELDGHRCDWGAAGSAPWIAIQVTQQKPISAGPASQPSCSQQAGAAAEESGSAQVANTALAGGDEGDWAFSNPATAAAFAQMRRRYAATGRRRDVRQYGSLRRVQAAGGF